MRSAAKTVSIQAIPGVSMDRNALGCEAVPRGPQLATFTASNPAGPRRQIQKLPRRGRAAGPGCFRSSMWSVVLADSLQAVPSIVMYLEASGHGAVPWHSLQASFTASNPAGPRRQIQKLPRRGRADPPAQIMRRIGRKIAGPSWQKTWCGAAEARLFALE